MVGDMNFFFSCHQIFVAFPFAKWTMNNNECVGCIGWCTKANETQSKKKNNKRNQTNDKKKAMENIRFVFTFQEKYTDKLD